MGSSLLLLLLASSHHGAVEEARGAHVGMVDLDEVRGEAVVGKIQTGLIGTIFVKVVGVNDAFGSDDATNGMGHGPTSRPRFQHHHIGTQLQLTGNVGNVQFMNDLRPMIQRLDP